MSEPRLRLAIWTAVSRSDKTGNPIKDKFSLPEQERLGRLFGDVHSFDVVKIFRWPGHSRDESDVVQALEDFAKADRYEYHELREMWRAKAFDVLWCHNHSRLGRSFTLQSWVIENIIRSGGRIYREIGGWIDEPNYGGAIALGGFAGTQERDRKIIQADAGMNARMEKGLNMAKVPYPHRVIRDMEDGKPIKPMEIDPANLPFLDHLYQLLMDSSVTWNDLGHELYIRWGHINPKTGKAWGKITLYDMLHRPSFWGHTARKFRHEMYSLHHDGWGYNVNAPVPDTVRIRRNTHEPAYIGQRAIDVQSAIRYRPTSPRGQNSIKIHPLSGIVFCPECYRQFHVQQTSAKHVKFYYLHCATHFDFAFHRAENDCKNVTYIRETKVQDFIEDLLWRAFASEDLEALLNTDQANISPERKIAEVQKHIDAQTRTLQRLILQSAEASESLSPQYAELIEQANNDLVGMQNDMKALVRKAEQLSDETQRRANAVKQLRQLDFDELWNHPGADLNRLLKDFFGSYALYALDGDLIGINLRPVKTKPRKYRV